MLPVGDQPVDAGQECERRGTEQQPRCYGAQQIAGARGHCAQHEGVELRGVHGLRDQQPVRRTDQAPVQADDAANDHDGDVDGRREHFLAEPVAHGQQHAGGQRDGQEEAHQRENAHRRAGGAPVGPVDHGDEGLGDPPQQHIGRRRIGHQQRDRAVVQILDLVEIVLTLAHRPEHGFHGRRHQHLVRQPRQAVCLVEQAQHGRPGELAHDQDQALAAHVVDEVGADDLRAEAGMLAHDGQVEVQAQPERRDPGQPEDVEHRSQQPGDHEAPDPQPQQRQRHRGGAAKEPGGHIDQGAALEVHLAVEPGVAHGQERAQQEARGRDADEVGI